MTEPPEDWEPDPEDYEPDPEDQEPDWEAIEEQRLIDAAEEPDPEEEWLRRQEEREQDYEPEAAS